MFYRDSLGEQQHLDARCQVLITQRTWLLRFMLLLSGAINIKEDYGDKFPMPEQEPRTKKQIPPHPSNGIAVRVVA